MKLSPEDLYQFRLRRSAVEQAVMTASMIQEGYRAWTADVKAKHEIEGAFDVNLETGEIVLREAPTDGR